MPRPKRAYGVTCDLHIRLTAREKKVLETESQKAALTVSEFVRRRALGIKIVSRMDDHVINELRRLGGLQKHLALERPDQKAEFEAVLREITQAIRRLG